MDDIFKCIDTKLIIINNFLIIYYKFNLFIFINTLMKDYQIIKEIESGFNGIIYFIKTGNEIYILKRQKILANQKKKNLNYSVWKEVDFSEKVNLMNENDQNFFMIMYDYNVIKISDKLEFFKQFEIMLNDKNVKNLYNSNWCLDIIYQYKNKPVFDLIKNNILSLKDIYHFIIQVLHAIIIMKNLGYNHNDLHFMNIMYKKSNESIKVGKYIIKSKYQYSLIDYGLVDKKDSGNYEQLSLFLNYLNNINVIIEIYKKNNWKIPEIINNPYSKNDIFNQMYQDKKVWNKIKIKLCKKYSIIFLNYFKFYTC